MLQIMTKHLENTKSSDSTKSVLCDGFSPSELIALREYYNKIANTNTGGCRSTKQTNAIDIVRRIENVLDTIAETII